MPTTDAILSRHPWLICPDALRAMAAKAEIFDPKAELPGEPDSDLLCIDDGIGVVSIHGPMLRRPGIIESILFGATDTEGLIAAVEEAGRREFRMKTCASSLLVACLISSDAQAAAWTKAPALDHRAMKRAFAKKANVGVRKVVPSQQK
ncbi:MAG TPA: hypothetical protein PLU30_06045 [Verrucomicrobiae bacterium]|nr:hypothetical protein [Verrucomicrobiae bacterium]